MNTTKSKEGPPVTHFNEPKHQEIWDHMANEPRGSAGSWIAGFWSGGGLIPFWPRHYRKTELPNINVKSPNA